MEKNLLLRIMIDSYERGEVQDKMNIVQPEGPFITISREHGCGGNVLARMISQELATRGLHWTIMSKEIIHKAAEDLNMSPESINEISGSIQRNVIDEILHSFSMKYYKSDRKVRKTIATVVKSAAESGNVIIVGRGGVVIAQGVANGLHIRLNGPLPWRIDSIMKNKKITREEAMKETANADLKRFKMKRDYTRENQEINDLFDVIFNCSKLTLPEIAKAVIVLMEQRGLINFGR